MTLWLIFGIFFILSLIAGSRLKSKFREYSAIPTANGMIGADVARKMLYDHGCYDVNIMSVQGTLTDQYNPQTKTVNLSQDVYYGTNVAAAAVAAHEAGYAVQHANAYAWTGLPSALVPLQNISATILNMIFIGMFFGSFLLGSLFPMQTALLLSVIASIAACGVSGVAGGSLLLIPLACSLFGISNDVAMQVVGVGFIIGVVQDSVETCLNSSSDVLLTATAELYQRRKAGEDIVLIPNK